MAGVGEREAAGMAQHVGMDPECETGRLAGSSDELWNPATVNGAPRSETNTNGEGLTHVSADAGPAARARRSDASPGSPTAPVNMQAGSLELDLLPPQVDELGHAQPVPEGSQDHGGVAMAVPVRLRRREEPLDLGLGRSPGPLYPDPVLFRAGESSRFQ